MRLFYKFNHYKLLDLNQFIELVEHLNRTKKNRKIVDQFYNMIQSYTKHDKTMHNYTQLYKTI